MIRISTLCHVTGVWEDSDVSDPPPPGFEKRQPRIGICLQCRREAVPFKKGDAINPGCPILHHPERWNDGLKRLPRTRNAEHLFLRDRRPLAFPEVVPFPRPVPFLLPAVFPYLLIF